MACYTGQDLLLADITVWKLVITTTYKRSVHTQCSMSGLDVIILVLRSGEIKEGRGGVYMPG